MKAAGVSVAEAARQLGVSAPTVRRWVAEGAPTVQLGRAGRGNGSRVDPDELRAWRAGGVAPRDDVVILAGLAAGIRATFVEEVEGYGRPAHAVVGLRGIDAAGYLVCVFMCCARSVIGRVPSEDEIPAAIRDLVAIAKTAHR